MQLNTDQPRAVLILANPCYCAATVIHT